jgi:DNA replication initiation complex subunit (GINS family)
MTGDEIGFSEISDVLRNERRSKTMTKLPVNFYTRAEEHLQKLRDEHCAAILITNNPSSMMLWDQISKLDKRLKHIYEIRERKITLAALDNMVGAPQPDNMTKKDKALYEQLVGTLTAFRNHSELQDCPPPVKAPELRPEPEKFTQPKLVEPEPAMEIIASAPEETIIVHVLEDIPTFVGLNNTYDLKKDDMVTLPSQFASLLSSKGKVRIVSG